MTMRNKLIEAAARAVAGSRWNDFPGDRSHWIDIATAAVDTALGLLMEPSEEMCGAGQREGSAHVRCHPNTLYLDNGQTCPGLASAEFKPHGEVAIFQAMLGAIK